MSDVLLSARGLTIAYELGGLHVDAVTGASFDVERGEILGLVGASGSGKSSIGYAVLGHLGRAGRASGTLKFHDADLLNLDPDRWLGLRGRRIGMVYQEPQSSLNPAYCVGEQIAEGLRFHHRLSRADAAARTVDWMGRVHLPEPKVLYRRYPHQLSGGQLQRVVIAMVFALEPELVVMDEPTTGLDVTTQALILDLVRELRAATGVSILYVSHDLGVVADVCDRVLVLHRGAIVEQGSPGDVLRHPVAGYTKHLVASIPDLYRRHSFASDALDATGGGRADGTGPTARTYLPDLPAGRPAADTVLEVTALTKRYRSQGRETVGCREVSFDVRLGECVAVIGESGSGKSTVARCILGLDQPTSGGISFRGVLCADRVHDRPLRLRRGLQIVFQNPDGSLNGRRTVGDTLCRPLLIHGLAASRSQAAAKAKDLLAAVDLPQAFFDRYPHELSGGQKQRVAIARAIASEPDLIVCDEAVSALDVSVQGTIIDLCRRLQAERGLAFLFITHDLAVVRQVASRAIVMLKGEVCFDGEVADLFGVDAHPYVKRLLASVPGKALHGGRVGPQPPAARPIAEAPQAARRVVAR